MRCWAVDKLVMMRGCSCLSMAKILCLSLVSFMSRERLLGVRVKGGRAKIQEKSC